MSHLCRSKRRVCVELELDLDIGSHPDFFLENNAL